MIKQWLHKRSKILAGILNTYFKKKGKAYKDVEWWDKLFYTQGVSDRQTISPYKDVITAKYHYASVELLILKYLRNHRFSLENASVLDIGSGSGHWIDFYRSLGADKVTGMDVSQTSADHLKRKYAEDGKVSIHHGKAVEIIQSMDGPFSLVNAIGVMFHIVDDAEWSETIQAVGSRLQQGGGFVVGGHFGWLDGLNVQIDKEGNIFKRLRSKRHWIRTLKSCGFTDVQLYRNNAYLWIDDTLPENNVLIAVK